VTSSASALPGRKRRGLSIAGRRQLIAWSMLTPAIASVVFLLAWPIWVAVSASLRIGNAMTVSRLSTLPLGWGNWERVLGDSDTWTSLLLSVEYTVGSMVPAFILGVGLAVLLNREFPGRRWIRSLMMLPWAVPGIVAGVAWLWLLDGSYGLINGLLRSVGIQGVAWYARSDTAMVAIILPTLWKAFPFFTLTALAAMQAIPEVLYEAARVDGAAAPELFRYITWPGIRAPMLLALVLNSLWAFKEIDIIYATTSGGPAGATDVLAMHVYQTAFEDFNMGPAAALGLLMMVFSGVLLLMAVPQLRQRFF
jgi:multiple sugar transport system permease protein